MNDELERLKRDIPILSLAESYGFQLKKKSRDAYMTLCLWHDDKNPSLSFRPSNNTFKCFGCGKSGTVIDLVMLKERIDTGEAIRILKEKYGPPPNQTKHSALQLAGTRAEVEITDTKYQKLLKQVFEYFCRCVKQNSSALSYLPNRGIRSAELLEEFQIGYCDNSLLRKLPTGKEGQTIRSLLKETGLLSEKGRLIFQNSLVFPIFDTKGNIVNIYGRRIAEKRGLSNHIYLPGKHRSIFNLKALESSKEIILCESVIDALSFWVHGFRNAVCSYGTNGLTDEHLKLFKEHKMKKVLIAFDNDEAGNNAVYGSQTNRGIVERFTSIHVETSRIEFPENNDPNEYIQRVKSPANNLKLLISSAKPLSEIDQNSSLRFDLSEDEKNKTLDYEEKAGGYIFTLGSRQYSFYGLNKNLIAETLKLRIKIYHEGVFYTDNGVDLFSHKAVKSVIKNSAIKLNLEPEVIERDMDRLLSILEEIQTRLIAEQESDKTPKPIEISEAARAKAMKYLKDKNIIELIKKDYEGIGLVGEEENNIIGHLIALSRMDDKPQAFIVQSSSGAGKTTFMDAVLSLIPPEDYVKYSALTGQSLYYMETNLKHKILAIVEEEGAERASYSLKLLQSEGKISIAVAGKDPDTGKMTTQSYEVEGPVVIMIATTNFEIDEELQNRCIIITVNESVEQTRRILAYQRKMETMEGLLRRSQREEIIELHHTIQRLLRPIHIINRYADDLTFYDKDHRSRRHQMKYLGLIRMIAFLRQYQKEIKTIRLKGQPVEYIEVDLDDIALANELAISIFGLCLDDLSPQTRNVLEKIYDYVQKQCLKQKIEQEDFRFTRRAIADYTNISLTQIAFYFERLERDEYIFKHKGKRGQRNIYELLYKGEGRKASRFALGLIDVDELRKKYKK